MKKVEGNGSILEPQRRSFFKRSGALAGGVVSASTLSALAAPTPLAGFLSSSVVRALKSRGSNVVKLWSAS